MTSSLRLQNFRVVLFLSGFYFVRYFAGKVMNKRTLVDIMFLIDILPEDNTLMVFLKCPRSFTNIFELMKRI